MAILAGTAKQILVDLINEANPDLPSPINTVDYNFNTPREIEPDVYGRNTEIQLLPKAGAFFQGSDIKFTYRRLDLANLFRNVTPHIQRWFPNSGVPTSNSYSAYLYDLLPALQVKYGIPLEESQIRDVRMRERDGLDPDRRVTMRAESDSLIYIGQVPIWWEIGKRTLESLYSVTEINGRRFPGGNDFSDMEARKPYLTPLTFNVDYSANPPPNLSTSYSALTTWMDENLPEVLDLIGGSYFRAGAGYRTDPATHTDGRVGVSGLGGATNVLPNSLFPEANSQLFNRVYVIEIPDDCPWGSGNLYFHYNV